MTRRELTARFVARRAMQALRALARVARLMTGSGGEPTAADHEVVPTMAAFADRVWTGEPRIKYVVCSTPRSGTTLLDHGLWTSGLGGMPAEYYNAGRYPALMRRWGTLPRPLLALAELAGYRASVLSLSRFVLSRYTRDVMRHRTGDNGVFGVKIHHGQYAREIAPLPLRELFPGARFIYIRRRDTVRQAVSLLKARQTGRYRKTQAARGQARYSFELLRACEHELRAEERGWERVFAREGIRPLAIIYEDLVENYAATVLAALRFIGVEPPAGYELPPPRIAKVADADSEAWVARYRRELAARPSSGT